MKLKYPPPPGSARAIKLGCTCPIGSNPQAHRKYNLALNCRIHLRIVCIGRHRRVVSSHLDYIVSYSELRCLRTRDGNGTHRWYEINLLPSVTADAFVED